MISPTNGSWTQSFSKGGPQRYPGPFSQWNFTSNSGMDKPQIKDLLCANKKTWAKYTSCLVHPVSVFCKSLKTFKWALWISWLHSRSVVLETDQLRLSTRNPWAELPRLFPSSGLLTARSTVLRAFPAPAFLASATCPTPAAFWVQDPWHTLSHLQRLSGLELFIQKPVEN